MIVERIVTATPDGGVEAPGASGKEAGDYRIIRKLYESDTAVVFRARRVSDGKPVVLKCLPARHTRDDVRRLRHEHAILADLHAEGVIRCYGLEEEGGALTLVLEDIGGDSLDSLIAAQRPSLREALALAVRLADAIEQVHAARVIHKDLSPANVLVNSDTGRLVLIDFGHATVFPREQPALAAPAAVEGTLHYVSPEQTGRMNRAVDYRTDFYSLGAVLYELFTGRRPFTGRSEIELIHCHIARQPKPPCELDACIPQAVSDIVLKLLAKAPEHRYQSAHGIRADLQECLHRLERTGAIETFPLGHHDRSDRFQIPQKLYGRDREIEQLLDVSRRAAEGASELALVSGPPGVGKSSLVRELHKPITARGGYFISGKFDQLQRGIPYQGIIAVFRELVHLVLGEAEERFAEWRGQLQQALGANGQIIVDVIPDVELIIGPQPPVQSLDRVQAQNRFNQVFRSFIAVFCQPSHPLVVYLDDLQWADDESLKLLGAILRDSRLRHLLVIGTYRDSEVHEGHALMLTLHDLRAHDVVPQHIALAPLGLEHVAELVSDTLHVRRERARPLANLILRKTGGNPFFTEEFLKSLHAENLLAFDPDAGAWTWDVGRIEERGITDNVVALMSSKLQRLPAETQEVLRLAACIGGRFAPATLAIVAQKSLAHCMVDLRPAVDEGLIVPLGRHYLQANAAEGSDPGGFEFRFAHDRIQQAAYGLIPEDARAAVHHRIGRLLLGGALAEKREEAVFALVHHLNLGVALIMSEPEQEELAELNLLAARKAKTATAYQAALAYCRRGIDVLGADGWIKNYPQMLALHGEAAEDAYLCGRYEEMEHLIEAGLARAANLLDKVRFYETRMLAEIGQGRLRPMLKTALTVLRLLGVNLPDEPRPWHSWFAALWRRFYAAKAVGRDLSALAPMTDERAAAAMRILPSVVSGAYWSQPALIPLVVTAMVRLSLKYGNAPTSPFGYVSYAMYLCGVCRDYDTGFRFGQLALQTIERIGAREHRAKTIGLFNTMVRHHKEALRLTLPALLEAYQAGVQTGDFEHAGNTILVYCVNSFTSGKELPRVLEELDKYTEAISMLGQKGPLHVSRYLRQLVLNLMGKSKDPLQLRGEDFDGEAMLPALLEAKEGTTLHTVHQVKLLLYYLHDEIPQALACADARWQYVRSVASTAGEGASEMYDALARLAAHDSADARSRRRLRRQVARMRRSLALRARHAPMTYTHRLLLVDAERSRVAGRAAAAMGRYDRAIASAKENGFLQDEALANWLAGKFYLERNSERIAGLYLSEARRLYRQWGAAAKVADLDKKYGRLLHAPADEPKGAARLAGTLSITHGSIDLGALMRALKDISGEKGHGKLLEKTLRAALAFAGAQKGLLLLRKGKDELRVEAESSVEREDVAVLRSIPLDRSGQLSTTVVNYVRRTKESIVVHDAQEPHPVLTRLHGEDYIRRNRVRSILCIPIRTDTGPQAELVGLLYLENNEATHTFTGQRIETLEIVCLAAAGRLELSREAVTDSLTGLYNHNYFQSVLRKEFGMARRKHRPLALILVDIDRFKHVNDTWGHQVGDLVLQDVAKSLRANCRDADVVARYGGEEMVMILPETDAAGAFEVAERVRSGVHASATSYEGHAIGVTVSIGVAELEADIADAAELIRAADRALYRSKSGGRNMTTVAASSAPRP